MHMVEDIDFQINSDSVGLAGSMGTLFSSLSLAAVSTPRIWRLGTAQVQF